MKRVFLELGGKSAFVLLDDGDVGLAAMFCSYATISHSGQGCAITSRLVVPRDRYDEVIDLARDTLAGVAYGDPTDPANMMGPLINARQREKVAGYVDRAIADGAKAVTGGRIPEHLPKGFFYEPTLLAGADENSAVAQDELFGPVLVVLAPRRRRRRGADREQLHLRAVRRGRERGSRTRRSRLRAESVRAR